jgi:ribonuclease-3
MSLKSDSESRSDSPTSTNSLEDDLPYNDCNIIISDSQITELLERFGITLKFTNASYYRNAFVHKSYCTRKNENFIDGNVNCSKDCVPLQEYSNERLEFLGDSILSATIASYLYERYPLQAEGHLTKIRTRIVNGVMLAHLSKEIGLDKYVLISKQIENNNGRNNPNILEDVFESLIGAIFIDFNNKTINTKKIDRVVGLGYQIASKWIINVVESLIDFAELNLINTNYKDTLIKYYQNSSSGSIKFEEVDITIKNNKKIFVIAVKNDGLTIGIGKAPTKKLAEQLAAQKAIKYLGI